MQRRYFVVVMYNCCSSAAKVLCSCYVQLFADKFDIVCQRVLNTIYACNSTKGNSGVNKTSYTVPTWGRRRST